MKILVVDIGYGGMLIACQIYEVIKKSYLSENYKIMFSSLISSNDIYDNSENDMYYNDKLQELINKYEPNIVFLACNTLSIIQNNKNKHTIVINIAKLNVGYMIENIKKNPNASIVIFGSNTTIKSQYYNEVLIRSGFDEMDIHSIACDGLASAIERGERKRIRYIVYSYVKKLLQSMNKEYTTIFVHLCCTHYSYVIDIFRDAFNYFKVSNFVINNYDINSISRVTKFLMKTNNNLYEIEFIILNSENMSETQKKTMYSYINNYSKDVAEVIKNIKIK